MLRCFLARGSSCQHHPLTRGTDERHMAIRGLGEIALRANNLDAMQKFYEKVIGLQLMTRVPNCAFFRIADGYGGHTSARPLRPLTEPKLSRYRRGNVHRRPHRVRIALTDFAGEKKRLEAFGLQVETTEHAWVHWRSLYVIDPEGNQVELVCYDGSV